VYVHNVIIYLMTINFKAMLATLICQILLISLDSHWATDKHRFLHSSLKILTLRSHIQLLSLFLSHMCVYTYIILSGFSQSQSCPGIGVSKHRTVSRYRAGSRLPGFRQMAIWESYIKQGDCAEVKPWEQSQEFIACWFHDTCTGWFDDGSMGGALHHY
jgi:hypothetical protein